MRGQMALEFFFAIALVYLSVSWLVNYLNAGYDSGRYLTLREEKMVAAEIAGIANSACSLNLSATINAPCIKYLGRPATYYISADGSWITVNASRAPEPAGARSLCQVYANLTAYNATSGMFEQQQMACNATTGEGTQVCIYANGTGSVRMAMGRCTS
ncbi:MAG: hypothetical protein WCX64_00435 [Candidatus Micrarchaeia archaeon]|jgi:hypothetical protein